MPDKCRFQIYTVIPSQLVSLHFLPLLLFERINYIFISSSSVIPSSAFNHQAYYSISTTLGKILLPLCCHTEQTLSIFTLFYLLSALVMFLLLFPQGHFLLLCSHLLILFALALHFTHLLKCYIFQWIVLSSFSFHQRISSISMASLVFIHGQIPQGHISNPDFSLDSKHCYIYLLGISIRS